MLFIYYTQTIKSDQSSCSTSFFTDLMGDHELGQIENPELERKNRIAPKQYKPYPVH